jgi:hypothetical protein
MVDEETYIPILFKKERMALTEILISSRSGDGIAKRKIMGLLETRLDEEFNMFLEKINKVYVGVLKLVYDETMDRCVAMTRADSSSLPQLDIMDGKHIALLMFCYYFCMTSRTNSVTFEELHEYFQRSSLYAQRKLLLALDKLVKIGYLSKVEEDTQQGEKRRIYSLTAAGCNAFGDEYLRMVLSQTQGGEVSMEQVKEFFNQGRVNLNQHDGERLEDDETPSSTQQSLFE